MSSTKEQKKNKKQSNFFYDFVKFTGLPPTWIWFRPKTLYISEKAKERIKDGALVAANHITLLDPIIVQCAFWYRRMRCVATKELANTPSLEKFFHGLHCIMIDKNNFNIGSLRQVCDALQDEQLVVIFPEGTVNQVNEEVQAFKSGVTLMAHLSHKPIIPMYIVKPKHWYSRRYMVIGEPVTVESMCGKMPTMAELDAVCAYLHEKEEELMKFYQQYKKKAGKK